MGGCKHFVQTVISTKEGKVPDLGNDVHQSGVGGFGVSEGFDVKGSQQQRVREMQQGQKKPQSAHQMHPTPNRLHVKNDLEITWNTDAYKWFDIYFTRMYANDFPGYQVNNFQFLCIKNRFAGWSKAFPFTPYFSVIKSSLTWSLVQNKAAHVPPSAESSWHESERPNTCSSGCIFGSLSNMLFSVSLFAACCKAW